MSWQPIQFENFEIADYRPALAFFGNIFEIANSLGAEVSSYEEEGLGPAHAVYLKNPRTCKFCILLHYEYERNGNCINIELKNQLKAPEASLSRQDLNEVISYIGISPESFDWVSELVK